MNDDNGKDLNGSGTGAQAGQPSVSASTPIANSAAPEDLAKLVESLVDRRLQSQKDTRIAKLSGEVDGFRKQLERLEALQSRGYNKEQALDYMALEEKVSGYPTAEAPKVGNPSAQPPEAPVKSVIATLALDVNDPQVSDILRSSNDTASQIAQLANLAVTRKASRPSAPEGLMPSGSGTAVSPEGVDQIVAQLDVLNQNPAKNIARIKELNAKLTALNKR